MACIGFDLDETLGRFSVAFYPLMFLTPNESMYNEIWSGMHGTARIPAPTVFSDDLKQKCENAFELFCQCIAEKEKTGLGLIRPEIIPIAKRLYELKQENPPRVKSVVIYSNNGNMATLRFAARVIEILAEAPGLFCNFLHWFHPSRHSEIQYGNPGAATKTFKTLVNAFHEGGCPRDEIDLDTVYFFDDLKHPDIANMIGDNYFHVPPYKVDANPVEIDKCFVSAFKEAGLETDAAYWAYIAPLQVRNLEGIRYFLRIHQIRVFSKIRPNNTNLRSKFQGKFPQRISKKNFTKALSTLRKYESKQNQGLLLTPNEEELLNKSRTIITTYESEHPNAQGGKRSLKTRRRRRNKKN